MVIKLAKEMEKTALHTLIKRNSFFRTCKPKGDKLRVTVCLTGNGNKKSLPFFQYLIVECGADEFCEPVPMNFDGLGYVFLSF